MWREEEGIEGVTGFVFFRLSILGDLLEGRDEGVFALVCGEEGK